MVLNGQLPPCHLEVVWGPYRQGQGLVAGASRSALGTGALGRAKNGSQMAGVRVGLDPVWKGDSKLSCSLPTTVLLGLVLNLHVRDASWCVWRVGRGRGTLASLSTPSHTPGLLTQTFSVATWVVTEHWVALGTQHGTGKVHAGRGTHIRLREQGTRHPKEHANREDPCRSKDATTRRR